MNIYLSEIAPFCTTDAEKVLWLRLKKIQKFRIKRHSDSFLLESLLDSFHIEEKYEPIMYYYEELLLLIPNHNIHYLLITDRICRVPRGFAFPLGGHFLIVVIKCLTFS